MKPHIEDEHNFGKVFPTPGPFPVLASRLQTGIWPTVGGSLSSLGLTSLQPLSTFGGMAPLYPCQSSLSLYQTNQITTTPVDRLRILSGAASLLTFHCDWQTCHQEDRSLVMRALGGAITSPCSNDSESRRPTPTIFGLSHYNLFQWFAVGLTNAFCGTLWETAILVLYLSWRVQLSL